MISKSRFFNHNLVFDVKPFKKPLNYLYLSSFLSTVAFAYIVLVDHASGDGNIPVVLGYLALTSAIFLLVGRCVKLRWDTGRNWFIEWGLIISAGVWLSRAIYIMLTDTTGFLNSPTSSAILASAWTINSIGTYFLYHYSISLQELKKGGESE